MSLIADARLFTQQHGLLPKRWPSLCRICQAWPSQPICEDCVQRFAQPVARCNTCAQRLDTPLCIACQHTPPPLDVCLCAVDYAYPWVNAIAHFKFQADPGLGRHLADLLRHTPWVEPALETADRVIPMPLSAQRLRERGFNQAHELARHLAPSKTDAHTLLRHEHKRHQVGQGRAERLANVSGSFWIHPEHLQALRGERVLVVDDVMTTGASLFEAARALRAAGAAHITGLVFARTPATPMQEHT